MYNSAGRGYPDLAAIGQDVLTYTAGRATLVDGTSASAPVIGSILTRINEERLAKGKPTIGFINPTIVSYVQSSGTHHLFSGALLTAAVVRPSRSV